MKKIFKISFIFLFIFMICFTGCKKKTKCDKKGHEWVEATCTTPKHCNICGTIIEKSFGHNFTNNNLEEPGVCTKCNLVDFSKYEKYSDVPYDNNIAINIRVMENRKSKYEPVDKKVEGEHEKSTFDLQLTLIKLQDKKVINNIRLYVVAKTIGGGYCFREYSSSTKAMSEYTYTSITSFSSFATKEFVNNELLDNTPERLYIKVSYTVSESNIDETLTYKVDVLSNNESKLSSAELRSIIASNATSNHSYVDPVNDPVRVKLTKKEATEETKLGSVKSDSLKIQFNVLKENLNKYKFTDDVLKANKLISIELPKAGGEKDAWDVYPEIKDIKFEIYAKVNSTDKDFSEYVKVYSVYGFLSKYRDLSIATAKLDESFDVENIYIVVEGKLHNATQDTFSALYSCKYSELSDYE